MIYRDSTVAISKGTSTIDSPIILYRGDREVEINFTIQDSPFRYRTGSATNLIEKTEADYAQLIIKVPNDRNPIFSEITETKKGSVILTITAEMIDEIEEVGKYDFQIRLFDSDKTSRATIPPVTGGIEIREPIAIEDEIVSTSNEVNVAQVNYAVTTTATPLDVFDEDGNYIETTWTDKMLITDVRLNKIEAGIDGVNKKVASGDTGGEVDLSGYVTKETGNANQITFADGQTFQAKLDAGTLKGDKGERGEQGLQGIKGDTGAQGPKGDTGAAGADGATFTPSVDAEGNLSWTNDKGLVNPPTVNIKGEKGDSGTSGSSTNNINDTTVSATTTYSSNKIEDALDKINQNAISDKNALTKQVTSNFNVLESEIDIVNNRISTVIAHAGDGTKDSEIVDARKGHTTLYDRLEQLEDGTLSLNAAVAHLWEMGSANVTNNVNTDSNEHIRFKEPIRFDMPVHITCPAGYDFAIWFVHETGLQMGAEPNFMTDFTVPAGMAFRVVFGKNPKVTITQDEIGVYANIIQFSIVPSALLEHTAGNGKVAVKTKIRNIFDKTKVFHGENGVGGYYNVGGFWSTNSDYVSSPFMPVEPGKLYRDRPLGRYIYIEVVFWDEDFKPCGGYNHKRDDGWIQVPYDKKIKYLTLPIEKIDINTTMVIEWDMSLKDFPTKYIPYSDEPQIIDEHLNDVYDAISLLDNRIDNIAITGGVGGQWNGKTWYAYGTSITSIAQGTYAKYLAHLSGMTLVNKGVSGGSLTNLGGYGKGEVKAAIMNTTDGKLNADLITLETGPNEGDNTPHGTIYDTGDDTYCGCLTQCLQYLQANTNAQIVVFATVARTTEPALSQVYYERLLLIEQVCKVNHVYFVPTYDGLGTSRLVANGKKYTVDNIHQSNLGGYNKAHSIWSILKDIPLFYSSTDDLPTL